MPDSEFKIVTGGGDWGSPLASDATFDSLKEAQAAAREYVHSQRQPGEVRECRFGSASKTRTDGSVVKHTWIEASGAHPAPRGRCAPPNVGSASVTK
jgi:hypothetical protein